MTCPTFTTDAAAFGVATRRVARFAPTTRSCAASLLGGPILQGILIIADTGNIKIAATDLETAGSATLAADVEKPGRVLAPAAPVARIARHLPGPRLRVEPSGCMIVISSGPTTWRLITMPDEDYPTALPPHTPLDDVRPAGSDMIDLPLIGGERHIARIRAGWRPPSPARHPYVPTGTRPGAPITWRREAAAGQYITVSGQIWSDAPGTGRVWGRRRARKRILLA